MTKGLKRSLERASSSVVPLVRTIQLVNKPLTVNGLSGVGFGSVVLDGLPVGNLSILAVYNNLNFRTSSGSVTATFDGDFGIGTAPSTTASLSGTTSNLIASTALGAATASVSPTKRVTNATPLIVDNTDGSLEVNLNLLIDDANISADNVAFLANGTVSFVIANLGK
jgi:hypothetical protein